MKFKVFNKKTQEYEPSDRVAITGDGQLLWRYSDAAWDMEPIENKFHEEFEFEKCDFRVDIMEL